MGIGKYVNAKPKGGSGGSLKVYIPEIMKFGMSTPRIIPFAINKAAFNNASNCKPALSSKINTQNYATAQAPYNSFENGTYYFGSDIGLTSDTSDYLICRLSPEICDNSTSY